MIPEISVRFGPAAGARMDSVAGGISEIARIFSQQSGAVRDISKGIHVVARMAVDNLRVDARLFGIDRLTAW